MERKHLSEIRFSQSSALLYERCAYAWEQSEIYGIRPRFAPAPLRRGTLVHKGLEHALRADYSARHTSAETRLIEALAHGGIAIHAEQQVWLANEAIAPFVTDEIRAAAEENTKEARAIFARAYEAIGVHSGKWRTVVHKGEPLIEKELEFPYEGFASEGCKIDWVAYDEDDAVWVWDFKTSKNIQRDGYHEPQIQAPSYMDKLERATGIRPVGSVTYQIRAKVPSVPELLKNGQMSRAKIASTWEVYQAALIENGLDPADYEGMKAKLSGNIWQQIDRYDRNRIEVATVKASMKGTALRIAQSEEARNYPRNLNPLTCSMCKLQTYCAAAKRGHDIEFLRKTEYMREGEDSFFAGFDWMGDDE